MLNISQKAKNALVAPSRYIKFKIEVYFDGEDNLPTDITQDVISFDTIEEVSPATQLPFGGVSYNELSISLNNMQQLYTISNTSSIYNGKLIANKKVVLTYMVEIEEDVFEEIPGGIFYTDAWSSDNEALTATLICYDKLALYGELPVSRFRVMRDMQFKEAFRLLFNSVGLNDSDYVISDDIVGTVPYFWCTGASLNTCLDELSMYSMTNIYVNRSNKIEVVNAINTSIPALELSDDNIIYTTKSNPSYSNVYAGVNIKYNMANMVDKQDVCVIESINLAPGETTLNDVLFTEAPIVRISSIVLKSQNGAYIKSYTHTDSSISIVLFNSTDSSIECSIHVSGVMLAQLQTNCYIEGHSETNNILDITLPYVCSYAYAVKFSERLLDMFSRYMPAITLDSRGYPPIEPFDSISISSDISSIKDNFYITSITNSFLDGMTSIIIARSV